MGSNPATPTILILYEFRERQACSFPQSYVDRHVSIQKGTKKSSCGNRRNQKTPALSPPFARGDTGGCKKTFPKLVLMKMGKRSFWRGILKIKKICQPHLNLFLKTPIFPVIITSYLFYQTMGLVLFTLTLYNLLI